MIAMTSDMIGQSYKNILIIRCDRIGDVLLSTPALKCLRDAYPHSRIAVMVRPYAFDIVYGNPHVDNVIVYDKDGRDNGLLATIRFTLWLKSQKFDLSVNLHPTQRTNIIPFLAGIPKRVGYDQKWGFLLTDKVPHTKQFGEKHELEYTLDLVRSLGIAALGKSLYMPIAPESVMRVKDMLTAGGIRDTDTVVAVHPGASCPSKRWPADYFARLADELIEKMNAKVVIVAGPSDARIGNIAASFMRNKSLNLSGETSVADLAALFLRCALFISNDSGPVHIASAVDTPVISIFGRNQPGLGPKRWGPVGRRDVILQKDVGCKECLAHDCQIDFKCLKALSVDDVFQAARNMLTAR